MRRQAELGAEVKRMAAANEKRIREMLAALGRPVDVEPPVPPPPPARPVRRAVHAVTPAGGNWSVTTGDPSVHVEIDGSFVL